MLAILCQQTLLYLSLTNQCDLRRRTVLLCCCWNCFACSSSSNKNSQLTKTQSKSKSRFKNGREKKKSTKNPQKLFSFIFLSMLFFLSWCFLDGVALDDFCSIFCCCSWLFSIQKKIPPCFPGFSSRPSSGCLDPLDFGSGSRGSPGTRFCSDLDVENGKCCNGAMVWNNTYIIKHGHVVS